MPFVNFFCKLPHRVQEGRRGSEEVVPEILGVPLQGDRDAGELCGGASRVPSTVSTSNS